MFNLKPEEVNFEKIEAFCKEQIPEGETIEYKGDFPSNLEKSISAMANTYGGIILIGVEADQTTNTPILPIKEREFSRGLEEKVTSICLRKIYHPYIPWVKVCPFKNEEGEENCVVFIRAYESDQTPHAINDNTDVYLRIRSQNEPFRKATVDEIEWLKDRRKKALQNRANLLKRADQRFKSMPWDQQDQFELRDSLLALLKSYRKASIIPAFPSRPLLQHAELLDLRNTLHDLNDQVFVLDEAVSSSDSLSFPRIDRNGSGNTHYFNYTEFNVYGLVYNRQSLFENRYPKTTELLDISYLLKQIYRVVTAGKLLYEKVGYYGSVMIEVDVGGIRGKLVGEVGDRRLSKAGLCTNIMEPSIRITRTCSFAELNEKLDDLLVGMCKEFLWCCGAGERIKGFEDYVKNLVERTKESFSAVSGAPGPKT